MHTNYNKKVNKETDGKKNANQPVYESNLLLLLLLRLLLLLPTLTPTQAKEL